MWTEFVRCVLSHATRLFLRVIRFSSLIQNQHSEPWEWSECGRGGIASKGLRALLLSSWDSRNPGNKLLESSNNKKTGFNAKDILLARNPFFLERTKQWFQSEKVIDSFPIQWPSNLCCSHLMWFVRLACHASRRQKRLRSHTAILEY